MPQFLRPNSDISVGGWGTTPLWSKLSETTPDDATTEIVSAKNPTNDAFEVGLTTPAGMPQNRLNHVLRLRMNSGGKSGYIADVTLLQGSTTIQSFTGQSIPIAYGTLTLSISEANAQNITDYSQLRVRVNANGGGGGYAYATWIELQIPDQLIQKSGSASISGRGTIAATILKAALVLVLLSAAGNVAALGQETFHANVHGGGSLLATARKGAQTYNERVVADDFNRPDYTVLPAPWARLYLPSGYSPMDDLGSFIGQCYVLPSNGNRWSWMYHGDTGPTNRGKTRLKVAGLYWTTSWEILVRAEKTGESTGRAIRVILTTSGFPFLSVHEMVDNTIATLLPSTQIPDITNGTLSVEQVADNEIQIWRDDWTGRSHLATVYPTQITIPGYSGIRFVRTSTYYVIGDNFEVRIPVSGTPAVVTGGGVLSGTARKGADGTAAVSGGGMPTVITRENSWSSPIAISGGGTVAAVGAKGGKFSVSVSGHGLVLATTSKGAVVVYMDRLVDPFDGYVNQTPLEGNPAWTKRYGALQYLWDSVRQGDPNQYSLYTRSGWGENKEITVEFTSVTNEGFTAVTQLVGRYKNGNFVAVELANWIATIYEYTGLSRVSRGSYNHGSSLNWSGLNHRLVLAGTDYKYYVNGQLKISVGGSAPFDVAGEAGIVNRSQYMWQAGVDNFAVSLPGTGVSGNGTLTMVGKKGGIGAGLISGNGNLYASVQEEAYRTVALSGGGTISVGITWGARKTVSVSGSGVVVLEGIKGGIGNAAVSGGGTLSGTGDVDAGTFVWALIRGGGELVAVATKHARAPPVLSGGGELTVGLKRSWPYIELTPPADTDSTALLVLIELDYCGRTFGISPCLAAGSPCYNTWRTCKYLAAYQNVGRTYRFCSADFPQVFDDARPYVTSVRWMPTEIKTNLTINARVVIEMADEPDTDVGVDPYWDQRPSHPGTFWKKFLARNVNYKGRTLKIYEGRPGAPESTYVLRWIGKLDNITVKGAKVSIESVDLLKDLAKIEVPPKVNAKLAADVASDYTLGISLTEDVDKFPSFGYVRTDDEIIRYESKDDTTKQLSTLSRGQFGTLAAEHQAKTKVQPVRYFEPISGFGHLLDMLVVDAGMESPFDGRTAPLYYSMDESDQYVTMLEGYGADWPSSGALWIGDELLRYDGVQVLGMRVRVRNFTVRERGYLGSPIMPHVTGETVRLLSPNVGSQYVDYGAFLYWKNWPQADIDFTAVVSEPKKLSDLFFEVVDLLDAKVWVAENLKITIRRNIQNAPGRLYHTLSDEDDITLHSGSVDLNEKSRITRMSIYWDKDPIGQDDGSTSYRRLDIAVDPDAEDNYDGMIEKKVLSRWIDPTSGEEGKIGRFVQNLGLRRITRQRDAQPLITLELPPKDASVLTGDYVRLSTDELLDEDGSPITRRIFQVVKRERKGDKYALTLLQVARRRVCIIGPAGLPDYGGATEAQREYGFITDSQGKMSDNAGGYYVW
jgi:hypothetical protein